MSGGFIGPGNFPGPGPGRPGQYGHIGRMMVPVEDLQESQRKLNKANAMIITKEAEIKRLNQRISELEK